VTVNDNDTSSDIAVELYNKKVVKSTQGFHQAATAEPKAEHPARRVQAAGSMPASAALKMLLDLG
jgi:hypothetical protein